MNGLGPQLKAARERMRITVSEASAICPEALSLSSVGIGSWLLRASCESTVTFTLSSLARFFSFLDTSPRKLCWSLTDFMEDRIWR